MPAHLHPPDLLGSPCCGPDAHLREVHGTIVCACGRLIEDDSDHACLPAPIMVARALVHGPCESVAAQEHTIGFPVLIRCTLPAGHHGRLHTDDRGAWWA